jgi:hypothetical protein
VKRRERTRSDGAFHSRFSACTTHTSRPRAEPRATRRLASAVRRSCLNRISPAPASSSMTAFAFLLAPRKQTTIVSSVVESSHFMRRRQTEHMESFGTSGSHPCTVHCSAFYDQATYPYLCSRTLPLDLGFWHRDPPPVNRTGLY